MTEIQWGAEIPVSGDYMPDWLVAGTTVMIQDGFKQWDVAHKKAQPDWAWKSIPAIRLPADHPYYAATEQGFTYWPGGETAPEDWDGGKVLLVDGMKIGDRHLNWGRSVGVIPIIGYRRRTEPSTEPPVDADTAIAERIREALKLVEPLIAEAEKLGLTVMVRQSRGHRPSEDDRFYYAPQLRASITRTL